MRYPYFFRQLFRRPLFCASVVLLSIAMTFFLIVIQKTNDDTKQQIEEIYKNASVTCEVSNLTGTQTDGLYIHDWVIRLFFHIDVRTMEKKTEVGFGSYLSAIHARTSVDVKLDAFDQTLIGITDIDSDARLRADEGCDIVWHDGFSEEIFGKSDLLCLVPVSMSDYETVTLSIPKTYGDQVGKLVTFKVAGTYHSNQMDCIYAPWEPVLDLLKFSLDHIKADYMAGTIADYGKIDEFWGQYASLYFVEPTKEGTPVPWENSAFETYPFALRINDTVIRQTLNQLEDSNTLLKAMRIIMLTAAIGISFVFSFLALRHREHELRLHHLMGVSHTALFSLLEQMFLCASGCVIGICAFVVYYGCWVFTWTVPVYVAMYVIGTGIAAAMLLRKKNLEQSLGGE